MMTSSSLSFTTWLLPLSLTALITSLSPPPYSCCPGLIFSPSSPPSSISILLLLLSLIMSSLYAYTSYATCVIHTSATSHTSACFIPPAFNKPNSNINYLASTERRNSGSITYMCTSPTPDIFIQVYSYFYPTTHFPSNPRAFSLTCAACSPLDFCYD